MGRKVFLRLDFLFGRTLSLAHCPTRITARFFLEVCQGHTREPGRNVLAGYGNKGASHREQYTQCTCGAGAYGKLARCADTVRPHQRLQNIQAREHRRGYSAKNRFDIAARLFQRTFRILFSCRAAVAKRPFLCFFAV